MLKWRWKLLGARELAVLVLMLVAGVAMVWGYMHWVRGNYEATAVLRYEQPLSDFRRMITLLANEDSFDAWVSTRSDLPADLAADLRRSLARQQAVEEHLSPFFRLTRRDLRELPVIGKEDDKALELIGIRLEFAARSPEQAEQLLRYGAAYVRDVALKDAALVYVAGGRAQAIVDATKVENQMIARRFAIDQLEQKQLELSRLRRTYPESSQISPRQILSAAGDSSKFLPPAVQLVGVESELIDARRDLAKLKREYEQAVARGAFFEKSSATLQAERLGSAALDALTAARSAVLPARTVEASDALAAVDNSVKLALDEFRIRYVDKPMFVSGDAVQVSMGIRTPAIAALGAALGIGVWFVWAFGASALAWLREGSA